ncbi:MAG: prolipoprotein diacylglyceryl transferase [Candidatus Omnitrophota bacterium]|nr:prolipoprotein diacylglyceryl transferase [Candidatus Omnitrophota bacterium]
MFPIFLKIGPITIYYYGLFIVLGILAGYFISLREAQRQRIDKNIFFNIFFWTLVFSFLGAKIVYILLDFKNFLARPLSMVRTGFVFYGGVIFGLPAFYLLTKRYKIVFREIADALALGIPVGHALGRIGCFSYGCCYGKRTNSFLGVLFPSDSPAGASGVKVIPTQLIESFFLLIIFLALNILKKRKKFEGQLFLYYLIFYAILRFIIEFFRGDERGEIFSFSVSQVIALVILTLGIFLWRRWKNTADVI